MSSQSPEDAAVSAEAERIREVYDGYRRQDRGRQRWSAAMPGNQLISDERDRKLLREIERIRLPPLARAHLLELGCGSGGLLGRLVERGLRADRAVGVELLEERADEARRRFPSATILHGDATRTGLESHSFDYVVLSTVVSSIRDRSVSRAVAAEARRLTRPGGAVLWYDMRVQNPSNREVRAVKRGELRDLFPGWHLHLTPVTVAPPLARRIGRLGPWPYRAASHVRPLLTHWLGVFTPATESTSDRSHTDGRGGG